MARIAVRVSALPHGRGRKLGLGRIKRGRKSTRTAAVY